MTMSSLTQLSPRKIAMAWCQGKQQHTRTYQWFLAQWARRLSWQETARIFRTSWQSVFQAVKHAVLWGLVHDVWHNVHTLGVDEIAWRKGHSYLTLVYQLDAGRQRLLWVGQDRDTQTLEKFFRLLGEAASGQVRFVCSDMWQAYLTVIAERASQAVHVLDRFHVMRLINKAIDEVRRAEVKQLERDGYEPVLKHARWCLLKRKENRTSGQTVKLKDLLQYNLRSVKAHLQREGLPAVLGVPASDLGGEVPGRLVPARAEDEAGAAEESRADVADSSRVAPQLVRRRGAAFSRHCRRLQQQGETDPEKSVWFQVPRNRTNGPVSHAIPPPRTEIHPRILVRRQK